MITDEDANDCIMFLCLGERTFGVLTKLDLMDKGTNALEVGICYT